MRKSFILPIVSGALLLFATQHVMSRQQPSVQSPPPVEPAQAPFAQVLAGAGLVEAQTENLRIGSPLTGIVDRVFVKAGQTVKPGAPLFTLDARQIRADVAAGEARLAAAEAELAKLESMPRPEDIPPIEAQRREMEAQVVEAKDLLDRATRLVEKKAISDQDVVSRKARFDTARGQLDRIVAEEKRLKAGAWVAEKQIARAAVLRARAEIEQFRTEEERHTILTPAADDEAGEATELVVLQVDVRPGEAVAMAPSTPLLVLGNVRCKHLRVDVDEHDIPRFRTDAPAVAYVRGDAQLKYRLTFLRVEPYVIPKRSLTGDNTERVDTRVLQALYRIDEEGRPPVYVGQQMDVFVGGGE